MFAKILRWLGFIPATVDHIVADFDRVRIRLEAAVGYHKDQGAQHVEAAETHTALASLHTAEALRAATISDNIAALTAAK